MQTNKEPTCAELVQSRCDSTLHDIRLMLDPKATDAHITEEGTTPEGNHFRAISICGHSFHFQTLISDDGGAIFEANEEEIRDTLLERFYEYAIDFSYIAEDTYIDQPEGYARYQISWGGPATEIRFYCDSDERKPYCVEFWYLDWFDGACVDITEHETTALLTDALGFNDWLTHSDAFWGVE